MPSLFINTSPAAARPAAASSSKSSSASWESLLTPANITIALLAALICYYAVGDWMPSFEGLPSLGSSGRATPASEIDGLLQRLSLSQDSSMLGGIGEGAVLAPCPVPSSVALCHPGRLSALARAQQCPSTTPHVKQHSWRKAT
jgi:hypothetical protein